MIVRPESTPRTEFYSWMIRCIAPRPIAWVSTISRDGITNLAPFSFFTAISTDPPTLCFAPGRHGNGAKKDTLLNIEATGEFVVNLVPEELAEAMNVTATEYPHGVSEFSEAGLTPLASERVKVPRVAESPIQFECERYQIVQVGPDGAGGAALVIGKILLLHVDDALLTNGKVDYDRYHPLGRLGGMEYSRTRDHFVMLRKKYTPKA
ncbi:MAG TPA: flavin reductase family protein [Candidatus Krumholzibacteria bacterium]|nr:flavin reductase family protein [Candidatus Krumholzibacteria bacterium]